MILPPQIPSPLPLLLPLVLLIFASSFISAKELGGEKLAAARSNFPSELMNMNPVMRSQIRQRLRQLKLKNEAALRRRGTTPKMQSSLGISSRTNRQTNNNNKINQQPQSAGELSPTATTNQLLPTNRNCFFSPINCQLPVPLIGLRQRSIKRRIFGGGAQMFQRESNQEEEDEEGEPRESSSRIDQYITAMANVMRTRQQKLPQLVDVDVEGAKRRRRK